MNKTIVLSLCLLLIGCSKQTEIQCQNITINNTINNTIEIVLNNTIIKEINKTCPETSKEIELIRRIKLLEKNQEHYFNDTECDDVRDELRDSKKEWNFTQRDLDDCEQKLCEDYNDTSWC